MTSIIFWVLILRLLAADHGISRARADTINTPLSILADTTSTPVSSSPTSSGSSSSDSPTTTAHQAASPISTATGRLTSVFSTVADSTPIQVLTNAADLGSSVAPRLGSTGAPAAKAGETPDAASNQANGNNRGNAPKDANAPSPTINPEISREIINGLISSLVPSAAGGAAGGNQLGPFGLLPTISKLSTPIARLIVSNGKASVEDIDQLLKAVPDVAVLLGLAGILGANAGAGGIAGLKSLNGSNTASNFTNWTPQQVNDLISGAVPLPPLASLPPDYIRTVLSNGALPGLTIEQTQALKQRYMQQTLFGDGSIGGAPAAGGSGPLIGNVYANISASQSITISKSSTSDNTVQELKNLDLSQLPPDVVRSFLAGDTPDLSKIPQDFLQWLINKNPQLFARIVSAQLQKKIDSESVDLIGNQSLIRNGSVSISSDISSKSGHSSITGGRSITPYDVNSLDRKADVSVYRDDDQNQQATLWTAVALGIAGLLMIILISVLCWRRQRNRRRKAQAIRTGRLGVEGILTPNPIGIDQKSSTQSSMIDETTEAATTREIRENRLNARVEAVAASRPGLEDSNRAQRGAYTQQWVFSEANNRQ